MSVYGGPADWWTDGTNAGRTHIATKGIVQSGLVLNLDAGVSSSYPGSGTTWTDLSGNGNNGTLINGPTFSSNNSGSIVFDGSDDIVNTSYVSTNIYTFSAWFRANTLSDGYRNIISIPVPNYSLVLLNTNSPNLGFWTSDGLGGQSLSTPTLTANVWYNVYFIREGNSITNGYKAYLNGVLYGSANTGVWSTSSNMSIGGRSDTTQFFNGSISAAQIYNRALSATEVQQNFNALRGRFGI
jgi:hypothetical protein